MTTELGMLIAKVFSETGNPKKWLDFGTLEPWLQDNVLRAYALWIRSLPSSQVRPGDYEEATRIFGESLVSRIESKGGTIECSPDNGQLCVSPVSCLTLDLRKDLKMFEYEARLFLVKRRQEERSRN